MSDALLNLIDPSEVVAYRPALGRALGSINAALFLSQAVYWYRIAKKMGNESFFKLMECEKDEDGNLLPPSSSHKQSWEWELGGMTRRQQEAARKILVSFKLIKQIRKGTPAKLYYAVDVAELEKFIIKNQQFGGNVQSSLAKRDNQDVPKSTIKTGENGASITESTPEINSENTPETQRTPHVYTPEILSRAKIICDELIKKGFVAVSANNPHFLFLLNESNWDKEFEVVADGCTSIQMHFNYILATIQGRRDDAIKEMNKIRTP